MNCISERVNGRWYEVLTQLGIASRHLTGKHTSCPVCGGRDRFRFDDLQGRGTYFCGQCGAGDGFALLQKVFGWSFAEAAAKVEAVLGDPELFRVSGARKPAYAGCADVRQAITRILRESEPATLDSPVGRYLRNRGLTIVPETLLYHPDLPYMENGLFVGRYPAMVAPVTGPNGSITALHRTFLTKDGHKAQVAESKKLLGHLSGGAVRLFPDSAAIGLAEGIETALSAMEIFALPVWATLSTAGLAGCEPPPGIEEITIFADHDEPGLAAARACADRLHVRGIQVRIVAPIFFGRDWNDELLSGNGGGECIVI